ncbi:MAG: glycosyltransferase family 1 protein [bacterium]|nr:glycosyltransferase family 1 protein [bacterium]
MGNSSRATTLGSSKTPVVAVDARCLAESYRSGVGEYVYHLLTRLPKLTPQLHYRWYWTSRRPVRLPELAAVNADTLELNVPSIVLNAAVRFLHRPRLDALAKADAVFLPSLQSVALRPGTPLGISIADLSFERYPEFFTPKSRFWHAIINPRYLCQRASQIVVNSEHTRRELQDCYRVPADRITVAYLGYDPLFSQSVLPAQRREVTQRYRLPSRFVLAVGNLEPRKNLGSLIAAYDRLQPDADLVIVGRPVWRADTLYRQAAASRLSRRIHFLGYVAGNDRPALYQLAACLAYPSYYEGFGLPALEAMAAGTPVVASSATSLPEVVGAAGVLVDPYDISSIAEGLRAVLNDENFARRLSAAGRLRAQDFSWDETARKTAPVIARLCS